MDEEEELRQKKMQELMKKAQNQQQQESENEAKINQLLNRFLTDEARARLNNVRLVKKEIFNSALQSIIYLVQQGHINDKIDDEQLKSLLERLTQKKEISIKRK